jgi:hypothetical protein
MKWETWVVTQAGLELSAHTIRHERSVAHRLNLAGDRFCGQTVGETRSPQSAIWTGAHADQSPTLVAGCTDQHPCLQKMASNFNIAISTETRRYGEELRDNLYP